MLYYFKKFKMNSSSSFKFHRFQDTPTNYNSLDISKYLLKSMRNNEFKNSFTSNDKNNSNNESKIKNNNLTENLKLLEFKSNLNNSKEKKNIIPIEKLIEINLENKIKNNDDPLRIKDYVSAMANYNLEKKNKALLIKGNFKILLQKYQDILKYLLKTENNVIQYNNLLEQTFNDIKKEKPKIKFIELDEKIEKNKEKILDLNTDIENYKNKILLINEKQNDYNYNNKIIDIHDDENNYYCDICADLIFNSYDEVVNHYYERHQKILKKRYLNFLKMKDLSLNNEKYEKFYFNNELDFIKTALNYYTDEIQKERNKNEKKKNIKNNNINNFRYSDKELLIEKEKKIIKKDEFAELFENKLSNLERTQRIINENIQKNFMNFKNEIISALHNLNNNPSILNNNINNKKLNNNDNNILGEIYDSNSIKNSTYNENYSNFNKGNESVLKNKNEDNKNSINDFSKKLIEDKKNH